MLEWRNPRGQVGRVSAAVAVVLLVAGQLANIAHELAVEHVRCAEHGELLDVPASANTALTPPADPDETRPDRPGLSTAFTGPAHDNHGHCAFHATEHATETLTTPGFSWAARSEAPPRRRETPAVRGIELARLAPKTSPPASVVLA